MSSYYLTCRHEPVGHAVRVAPSGYLNDQTEGDFERAMAEVVTLCERVVLDCSELVHISSIGFGTLLAITGDLRRRGGDLRLASLAPALQRALSLAFGEYLRVYATAGEAVHSFDAVTAG